MIIEIQTVSDVITLLTIIVGIFALGVWFVRVYDAHKEQKWRVENGWRDD